MIRRTIQIAATLLCCVCAMCLFMQPAFANSAQTYFYGVDANGAILRDSQSPIVVEHEQLVFDIDSFPSDYYVPEESESYRASVTAQYSFYNPSEYMVTSKLLFPFGKISSYALKNEELYQITVDGVPTERKVRHTYSPSNFEFDWKSEVATLCDTYVNDAFYRPETTVTVYGFRVEGVDQQQYDAACAAFDIGKIDGTRILFPRQSGYSRQKDGIGRYSAWIRDNGDDLFLIAIGKPLQEIPQWTVYRDGGTENGEEIAGTVRYLKDKTQTISLQEYLLQDWSAEKGVSDVDWFNAKVAELHSGEWEGCVYNNVFVSQNFTDSLMSWYEYELTFEPQSRLQNAVTAPLFPAVDIRQDPIFFYTYLLSPAKSWKSFADIDIQIRTPYFLVQDSANQPFERTEYGYRAVLNGLPDGELAFALSESENAILPQKQQQKNRQTGWVIALSVGAAVLCVGGGAAAYLIVRQKHRVGK